MGVPIHCKMVVVMETPTTVSTVPEIRPVEIQPKESKPFVLPESAVGNDRIIQYLVNERGLSRETVETFINMGLSRTVKAGFSYLKSTVSKKEETSLENFYINRFGKVLYSMFFEGYTEKLWGRHPSEISADWGAQRVKGLSILAVLKDMASKLVPNKNRKVETSLIEEFVYPKFGPGQLWETTAEEFEKLGVPVTVTTVDGSEGVKGFVTDALPADYTYFYTCGPEPMLKALYKATKTSGQFSFEERMGCGFGACMGCSCKTITGNKRICKEGPVLKKEEILWQENPA